MAISEIAVCFIGAIVLASPAIALSPGCIFAFNNWELQLPVGSPGSPTTISASQLEGCSGFQDQYFFYGSSDATVVMTVPGSPSSAGCVTTPNSEHCRTELRETNPSSWDPNSPINRMEVFLSVVQPDNSQHGTVVGQIHIDDSISSKPVCQIYYSSSGDINLGIEQTRSGGDEQLFYVGTVPVGTTFSYRLSYENGDLSLSLNNQPAQTYTTFSLNAPASYFKVGNYNQGSSPSEVHFFLIDVTHNDPNDIPTAPPASTISFGGIGPVDIITTLSPIPSFFPSKPDPPPTVCASTGPGNSDDNTVTLELYGDQGCCNPVEHIKIGNLNECKDTNAPFSGFTQSVGQNLFGKGIHVEAYTGTGCSGLLSSFDLTNQAICFQNGITWQSFKVAPVSSSGSTSTGCATQPSNSDANTVTLDLYTPGDCCSGLIETIKIGTLGVCHKSNSQFQGVTQSVGQSLFGHATHVQLYADSNCQSLSRLSIDLSNNDVCYNTGFVANSLLVGPSQTAAGGGAGCQPVQASNTSPNTVTLQLAASDCCTFFETITVGNFNVCHKSNQAFEFFSQAVGSSLFGQEIHVEVFNSINCSGSPRIESLTNTPQCYTGDTWNSLMISSGSAPAPPKCGGQPAIQNANTVTLNLFPDTACCDATVETITMGNLNSCHNSNQPFNAITEAVGQSMFGRGIHIHLYPNTDCSSDVWGDVELSNNPVCIFNQGPAWLSFMLVG